MPLPSSEIVNSDATKHAELMLKLHKTTKQNIEHMNAKYKFAGDKGRKELKFEPRELVWLHLRKDRFPELRKSKLFLGLQDRLKCQRKLMTMHMSLNCLQILGLVPHLTLQI